MLSGQSEGAVAGVALHRHGSAIGTLLHRRKAQGLGAVARRHGIRHVRVASGPAIGQPGVWSPRIGLNHSIGLGIRDPAVHSAGIRSGGAEINQKGVLRRAAGAVPRALALGAARHRERQHQQKPTHGPLLHLRARGARHWTSTGHSARETLDSAIPAG